MFLLLKIAAHPPLKIERARYGKAKTFF